MTTSTTPGAAPTDGAANRAPPLTGPLLDAEDIAYFAAHAPVLVTGGTGFVGSHLCRALADAGIEVTCCGRNFYRTHRIRHERITFARADISDAAAVDKLVAGHGVVFHAAARTSPFGDDASFVRDNVDATAHVIAACRAHGARLVQVSSTSIFFAFRDREDVADDAPRANPQSGAYAQSKADAEDLVFAACRDDNDPLDASIVRARAVIGVGDTVLVPRLLRAIEKGRLRQVGDGTNVIDLCLVQNLVRGLVVAARNGRRGEAYTITNDEPVKLWPLLTSLLGQFGYPAKLRAVPRRLAVFAAGLVESAARLVGRKQEPMLTRYSVGLLGYSQTFRIDKAKADLGYAPVLELQAGIAHAAKVYRRTDDDAGAVNVDFELLFTGHTTHIERVALSVGRYKKVRFHSTVALLRHPVHGPVLFDTGYAPHFESATRAFPFRFYRWATPVVQNEQTHLVGLLKARGLSPNDIGLIVLSHFHADHVAGVKDFPKADLICHEEAAADFFRRRGINAVRKGLVPPLVDEQVRERLFGIGFFQDAGFGPFAHTHDVFGDKSIRLVELPGHCRGQIGALVQTEAGPRLLAADACWFSEGFRQVATPSFLTRFLIDSRRDEIATLRKLNVIHRERPEVEIIPCHCPEVAARYGGSVLP